MASLDAYKIVVSTKSPVFIGSGEKMNKKEYVYLKTERKVLIPDLIKMVQGLSKAGKLDSYENYLLGPNSNLYDFFHRNGINETEYKTWMRYSIDCGNEVETQKEIFLFSKDAHGNPYIPGSSLKGAIRTALLGWSLLNDKRNTKDIVDAIWRTKLSEISPDTFLSENAKDLETCVIETLSRNGNEENAVTNIMAGIRISDSHPLSSENLVLCQKIDIKTDKEQNRKNRINLLRECIKPGTQVEFDLTIEPGLAKGITKDYILQAIKGFYDHCSVVFLSAYKDVCGRQKCCEPYLIYLGGGSGYVSKTISYPLLFDKNAEGPENEIQKAVFGVSKIIHSTLKAPLQTIHRHSNDVNLGTSPHTIKVTQYEDNIYEMGLCSVNIEASM